MIQPNELRLENLIYKEDYIEGVNEVYTVNIEHNSFYRINEDKEGYHPIPLTEELLLKCGFEHVGISSFTKDGIKLLNIANKYFRGNFPIKEDIKHLHQLQNLYFALTGKELEIQL